MKFEDLVELYEKKKKKYGKEAYKYISQILKEAKEIHKRDWEKRPTPNKDHEQSWRAFKGKNFEKLITYIIKKEIEELGLKVVEGSLLERSTTERELSNVKRNLLVDYGEFGSHLPDVDIIIYEPTAFKIMP